MSGVLVDTHVALWWASDPDRLTVAAREAIEEHGQDVWISAVSLAEMAIKTQLGKLRDVPADFPVQMMRRGFRLLPLDPEHGWKLREIERRHADPFDRLLIAQALHERMAFVSADSRMREYPQLDLVW